MLSGLYDRLARLAGIRQGPSQENAADDLLRQVVAAAERGEGALARSLCEDLVARFPRDAAARRLLGMLQAQAGDPQGALGQLEEAAALAPQWPDAHLALGNIQQALRNLTAAETSYRRALSLDPAAAGAHYNLALLLRRMQRWNEALAALRTAHELEPAQARISCDFVQALLENDCPDEARAAAERTLAASGKSLEVCKALGQVHLYQHEAVAAQEWFRQAISLAPVDAEAWLQSGLAERELARFDNALSAWERALALKPGYALARWHRSLVRLMKGEFDRAWTDYEARLLSETWPRRDFPQPRWQGEPLAGKSLLVHAEQGLGDEIMFASCLPDIIAQSGHCVIDCHPKLLPIFQRSFPAATVHGGYQKDDVSWLMALPPIDYQVPIGSLALHTRSSRAAFPRHSGYLLAEPRKVALWRERLAVLGSGLKVGLSWQGGTRASRGHLRSLSLAALLPVLRLEGVQFVDLQYTDTSAERAQMERDSGVRLVHWPEALADYDETAALIAALDLTVSVCTAVAHLAGALGKPAWVMTPYSPEWRYGDAGDDILWYPSLRLFRQNRYQEWDSVINAVADHLAMHAAA